MALQREIERRSLVDRALGPDAPIVPGDDALDGREADAGSFEVRVGVKALEGSEELVRVCHVEASAVVPDIERGLGPVRTTDLHVGIRPLAGELPRVTHQVLEDDGQELGIGLRSEALLDVQANMPRGLPS